MHKKIASGLRSVLGGSRWSTSVRISLRVLAAFVLCAGPQLRWDGTRISWEWPAAHADVLVSQDIGAVGATGSYSLSGGTHTLAGSGADIWGTADEFRYAYRSLSGDGQLTARVASLTNTNSWAKAGVMIRETLAAGSRHGSMLVSPSSGLKFEYRATTGGSTAPSGTTYPGTLPHWVRIVRQGDLLSGYTSTDGVSWTLRNSATITLPATVYIGLAVSSHNDGTLATGVFDNVLVGGGADTEAPTVPTGLSATAVSVTQVNLSWTASTDNGGGTVAGYRIYRNGTSIGTSVTNSYSDTTVSATSNSYTVAAYDNATPANESAPSAAIGSQDIGAVAAAGSYLLSGGTHTLEGSGADIWGTADEFRFSYQTLSGDGSITARVASLTNTNSWAKAGVMIRETLAAGSRHVSMLVTPSSGSIFEYRTTTNGTSGPGGVTYPGAAPHWVRIVRAGNVFSGYTSTDGVSWTLRNSVTVALDASTYIGLAVTSHNDGTLATAVFDNASFGSGSSDTQAPTVPTGVSAAAVSATQVNLSWTASTDNGGGVVAGYRVFRNGVSVGTTASTSYTDTGLSANTQYSYTVAAYDNASPANESAPSNTSMVTTPAVNNTVIRVNAGGAQYTDTQGNVWAADYGYNTGHVYSVAGTTAIAGTADPALYRDHRSDDPPEPQLMYSFAVPNGTYQVKLHFAEIWSGGQSVGARRFNVLLEGTQVLTNLDVFAEAGGYTALIKTFQVTVADGQMTIGFTYGNTRDPEIDAIEILAVNDTQAPTVPTDFSATAASSTQINLSWTASTDNVAVTGYLVERCQGAGCSTFSQIATPTGTTYNDTGLTASTSYSYRVRAQDAVPNYSSYSSTSTATTSSGGGGDVTAPTTPTSFTATTASSTQINLSWTASTDNVAVTGYLVERCQGASCSTFSQIATPTGTTYNDTGLNASTSYSYRVRARDAVPNYSGYSSTQSATTQAASDTTAPTTPSGFSVTPQLGGQNNLAWNASTDNVAVTGYLIERCAGVGCVNFAQIGTTTTSLTYNDPGLVPTTNYSYRIRARDAVPNYSNYSLVASATPADCD